MHNFDFRLVEKYFRQIKVVNKRDFLNITLHFSVYWKFISHKYLTYLVNIFLIDVTPTFGNISRWRFVVFYYKELRLVW